MMNRVLLLFLICISIIAKNKPLLVGSTVVLILSFFDKYYIAKIDKNMFLNGGLMLLMIWMLMPLIQSNGSYSFYDIKNYLNIDWLVSFLSGFFIVIIAARGLDLLNSNPSILIGVIVGSIIGVTFFGGIPVGILTGSRIAYLIIKLLKIIFKY